MRTIIVATTMKTIVLLLSTLTLAAATIKWDALVATWRDPSSDPERLNSFYSIPRTRKDAVSAGWANAHVRQSLKVTTWCLPNDPRFCVLFDKFDTVAGIQIGELLTDVTSISRIYNMRRTNYYQIKIMFNRQVSTSVVWTRNPADLKSGRGSRTWNNLTGTEGVWFETKHRGYVEIPRNLADLDPIWTEQACIPSMGTHYYYDMYNTTPCANLPPWFLLFQNKTLTGVGHQVVGTGSLVNRDWNDAIPVESGIKKVVSNGPQCLYDGPVVHGLLSTHVYFTSEPWNITSCA